MKGRIIVDVSVGTPHLSRILDSATRSHLWVHKVQRKKGCLDTSWMAPAASVMVMEELRKAGVPRVGISVSRGHAAVLISSNLLVDPTIGRYWDGCSVYVGDMDSSLLPCAYEVGSDYCSSRKSLESWMRSRGFKAATLKLPITTNFYHEI